MEFKPNYSMSFSEMRQERWRSIEGFLQGIKPSFYENLDKLSPEEIKRLESYPSLIIDPRAKIYFQTENQKWKFIQETKDLTPFSLNYISVLGRTLGYPPRAVRFYQEHMSNLKVNEEKEKIHYATHHIGLKYCGIHCSSSVNDFVENVRWFWDTYKYPLSLWIVVDLLKYDIGADFRIPYRDEEELFKVKKTLEEILEQNRKVVLAKLSSIC